jgi:Bacteriophage Sf6, terminase small subunit-like
MPAHSSRTPDGDAKFFAALENGHPVRGACEAAGYTRRCVYRWRKEDPEFAAAWAEAMAIAGDLLEEEADRRGRDGYDEPVYYQGEERGAKRRYSDALLLARLKAVRPDQYRERINMPSFGQQNVTVVIRDFDSEDAMLRLVSEKKLSADELPARLRARLNGRRED